LKVLPKINNKTYDLREKDEIVVKVQHMFPNCKKYTKCCEEAWSPKLERSVKVPVRTDYTMLTEKDAAAPPEEFREPRNDLNRKFLSET